MDLEVVGLCMAICLAAGIAIGIGISPKVSRDFSCTESAVIEGNAMCVKYERIKT